MTDRPIILPPDHLLSDEDILTDLYKQYNSCVYLDMVYSGLLQMAELTGAAAGKGVTWEAVWTIRRLKAGTYRLITVMSSASVREGSAESAPELDLEQYKVPRGVSTTQHPKAPQKPSESDEDPFSGLGFTGFGDI